MGQLSGTEFPVDEVDHDAAEPLVLGYSRSCSRRELCTSRRPKKDPIEDLQERLQKLQPQPVLPDDDDGPPFIDIPKACWP